MVLVTGGTGFLGTHLLRKLVLLGKQVRALRRIKSFICLEKELTDRIDWVEGDVLDIPLLEQAINGCEQVYHCAAVVSFDPADREKMMKVNVRGTANIVNVSLDRKIKKLIYVSSVAALGKAISGEVINENKTSENTFTSSYGLSKFLGEREVWRGMAEGLNAVIVNPSLIIGSGNWNSGPPKFFTSIWNGYPFYSNGSIGIVDAEDVVNIMMMLMNSDIHSERFILNSGHLTLKEFFFTIADFLKKRRPYISVKPWMIEVLWREETLRHFITGSSPVVTKDTSRIAFGNLQFDHSKVVQATGYEFKTVKQSIEETAIKFLKHIGSGLNA